MRKLTVLALVACAAAALAAYGSAGTNRHSSGPSIATIADASTSFAEFSARVPNLRDVLQQQQDAD